MPRCLQPAPPASQARLLLLYKFLLVGWMDTEAPCFFKSRQLAGDFGGLHRATTEVKLFAAGAQSL
jgi:hypothetical protein